MTTQLQQKAQLKIVTLNPVYGVNYNKGYIGFTYDGTHPVGRGIAYFTKWDKMSNISATHALIVTGRKPKDLTDEIAERIVEILKPESGKKYDYKLILAHAFSGSLPGQILSLLSRQKIKKLLSEALNCPDKWICSELAAYALDEQPEYRDIGVLINPNSTINPQKLFEDDLIFQAWENQVAAKFKDLITGTTVIA
ncbi:MAG: hypothetical protein LW635_05400 [Microcystis sp. 53598_E5]|nr:hypothetical protein [Microcystis sp. 53598_E5]